MRRSKVYRKPTPDLIEEVRHTAMGACNELESINYMVLREMLLEIWSRGLLTCELTQLIYSFDE